MNKPKRQNPRGMGPLTRRTARLLGLGWWLLLGLLMAGCIGTDHRPPTSAAPSLLPPATPRPQPSAPAEKTPTPLSSPISPTPSPWALVPSMAIRTPTPTPSRSPALRLTITGHLYCRSGPGIYYPAQRVLAPGEQVRWIGANKIFYDWWYVALADGTQCWVHRHWVTGASAEEAASMPQVSPPPPPAGAFKPIRHQWPLMLPFCPAFFGPALQFQIKNLGPEPIRSFDIRLVVLENGAVYRTTTEEGVPTCAKVRTQIPPGETVALAARTRQDLIGKRVRLELRGCTEPHFQGACVAYHWTWTVEEPPRPSWFPRR